MPWSVCSCPILQWGTEQRSWLLMNKTSWWFLKDSNVYSNSGNISVSQKSSWNCSWIHLFFIPPKTWLYYCWQGIVFGLLFNLRSVWNEPGVCNLQLFSFFYLFIHLFISSSGRRVYFQFANRPFWRKTRKNPCRMLRPVCTKESKPIRKHCCAVQVLELWHRDQRGIGCLPWRSPKVNGMWCWAAVLGGPAGAEWDQRDPECLQPQPTWESVILDICNHRKKTIVSFGKVSVWSILIDKPLNCSSNLSFSY